jgi:hypothetical protein
MRMGGFLNSAAQVVTAVSDRIDIEGAGLAMPGITKGDFGD